MVNEREGISKIAIKAMGLFGGVQAFTILCSIVRTKLVAVWIGPMGVGLFALFNQALELLNTGTNLGMRTSSVRDIAEARAASDNGHISRVLAVVRRWSVWLAIAGAVATVFFSPLLSRVTFGDSNHIWGFVALSVAVMLMALTNGEYAILQGTEKLKRLAGVTLWGSITGLIISIPLFYYLRERSILPSILAYALACAFFAFIFSNREQPKAQVSRIEAWQMGKGFISMGIYMTMGTVVTLLANYLFITWLNHHSGTQEVGFFQAGYTLINKYAGIILAALGMEYYPRLSRMASDAKALELNVNREAQTALTLMIAVVSAFIVLRTVIIDVLYTGEFEVIATFISWGIIGALLRTLSWCIAFVILAKGDGKAYLITESLSAVAGLALHIGGYLLWGISGLGIAYLAWYAIYTIIVGVVYYRRYQLRISVPVFTTAAIALATSATIMIAMEQGLLPLAVAIATAAIIASLYTTRCLYRK